MAKSAKTTFFLVFVFAVQVIHGQCTFRNPVTTGDFADPYIVKVGNRYYASHTTGCCVVIHSGDTPIEALNAPGSNAWNLWSVAGRKDILGNVWAPEIHFVQGKWYAYTSGNRNTDTTTEDPEYYLFVLESQSDSPMGPYVYKGFVILNGSLTPGIDPTIFTGADGKAYMIYSKSSSLGQDLAIGELSNPWTLASSISISAPTYNWEREGWGVNEGPQVLVKNGKTHIIYSASGFLSNYKLGRLTNNTTEYLNPSKWVKESNPVFSAANDIFRPGHNGFFKSPDGTEDWILYHATKYAVWDTDGTRRAHMQKITWSSDDIPIFGTPISPTTDIPLPSDINVSPNALIINNQNLNGSLINSTGTNTLKSALSITLNPGTLFNPSTGKSTSLQIRKCY